MGSRTLVIVNPQSGGGATGRRWSALEPRVRAALGDVEVALTRARGDAMRLAAEAARSGVVRLIAAGGDGSLNEVVNGVLSAGCGDSVTLGLLPLGTGCDFARALGGPRGFDAALAASADAPPRTIDAGHLRCHGLDGEPAERFFVNEASFGLSARVVEEVERSGKGLGGTAAFLLGTLRGAMRHRCAPIELYVDGRRVFTGPAMLGAAANGQWFGGGMRIAPGARLDDALLDVVWVREIGLGALVRKLPKLYAGRHLGDPVVGSLRGARVEARAEPNTVGVEADGEWIGSLPAQIGIRPAALRMLALPGSA